MTIPKLTNPQYMVLSLLQEGEVGGASLREQLERQGQRSSARVFDRFMARLEDAGYAQGRYEQKPVGTRAITERVYSISGSGVLACAEFREFVTSPRGASLSGA
jgi:DNA-binding PadR family transcriptional regulator